MRNFEKIVKDVAHLKWSTVVLEESFAEVEENVKLAVKQANSYIFGLADFPFRIRKGGKRVASASFAAPKGDIVEMWIENAGWYLKKITPPDGDLLDTDRKGKPQVYWVDYGDNGAVVHLWPAPDKEYNFMFRYVTDCKARDMSGNEKYNLENITDVVNLPDDPILEDCYMHCLYTKAMVYLIADDGDENYRPYQREFEEAYGNLLRLNGIRIAPRILF
ncbi:MAG: hypothetical protein IJ689_04450 [Alphaproteobacteria bacterium]|nr:hypothetical protein [Alphaproteobacteria bacterium]